MLLLLVVVVSSSIHEMDLFTYPIYEDEGVEIDIGKEKHM